MKKVYRFKLLRCRNGLDQEFYRVKQQWFLWWYTHHIYYTKTCQPEKNFSSREAALQHIDRYIENLTSYYKNQAIKKASNTVTVLVEEKIERKL